MNFFERQDNARATTFRLTILFIIAIFAICTTLHFVGAFIWMVFNSSSEANPSYVDFLLDPEIIGIDFLVVGGLVLFSSLWKSSEVASAGIDGVARSIGGTQVYRGTDKPWERRLYNVVEEMAIAAGVPVPTVYIMEHEYGINACAFGESPEKAGICVTRGALDVLSRDELQGVIGHEFSHIVNSDVKLNVRLIGVLFGIEVLSIVALYVMKSLRFSTSSNRNEKNSGGGLIVVIFIVCLALFIIGQVGVFFGNLIRAAISRQREYLADASAVQFTRNPAGIAGALKKIGGLAEGSTIESPGASQMSHLFFGNVFAAGFMQSLFQTHPPLDLRIKAIDPNFDGVYPKNIPFNVWDDEPDVGESAAKAAPGIPPIFRGFNQPAQFEGTPKEYFTGLTVTAHAIPSQKTTIPPTTIRRQPTAPPVAPPVVPPVAEPKKGKRIVVASALLERAPAKLNDLINEPVGACAVFYALLAAPEAQYRVKQRDIVARAASRGVLAIYDLATPIVLGLRPSTRLVVLRLALPTIKKILPGDYADFRKRVVDICCVDNIIDLFEYAALASAIRELDIFFGLTPPPRVKYAKIEQIADELRLILSYLAKEGDVGTLGTDDAVNAYAAGLRRLGYDLKPYDPHETPSLKAFTEALNKVACANSTLKIAILDACYACVAYDGLLTEREAAILSAVTASLGVPAPIWEEIE